MNESARSNPPEARVDPRPGKPPRSERMADLQKKHVKAGAVAAGGLLALVGLAAVLLGA